MNFHLPSVAASMVMGSLLLVFSGWKFFDNYVQFSAVIFPPDTTFGDIYTVVIQMICHAATIITATVQILSAFEYIRQATKKEEDEVEAFQVWFGTLINLFLLNAIIFMLIEAMNWSQTDVKLHTQPTEVGINLCFMLLVFFLTCCIPCRLPRTRTPEIIECHQGDVIISTTVSSAYEKEEKCLEKCNAPPNSS